MLKYTESSSFITTFIRDSSLPYYSDHALENLARTLAEICHSLNFVSDRVIAVQCVYGNTKVECKRDEKVVKK